jgi:hypothetical protein
MVIGGVTCYELTGSNKSHAELADVSATRVFRVAWANRITLRNYFLGLNIDTTIRNPRPHPEEPELFVHSVDIEPYPDTKETAEANDCIQYEWARLTVVYKPIELSGSITRPEPFSESYDFAAEFLTRSVDDAIHQNASLETMLPPGFSLGVLIPSVEYEYVRHRMAAVPTATIYNCLGKVNNATFLGADPGHVLYTGARARSSYDPSGVRIWEVQHRFAIRGGGTWNEFYVPGAGWGTIRLGTSGPTQTLYQSVNLAPLLNG